MHPNYNQRQNVPRCRGNPNQNLGENSFNAWRTTNMHGQMMQNVPPHFNEPPQGNFGPQYYSQSFNPHLPPPIFGPPFSNAPQLPPPVFPQDQVSTPVNERIQNVGGFPPPSLSLPEKPSNFLPSHQGLPETNLHSKSVTEWLKSKSFRKKTSNMKHKLKFEIHEYRLRLQTCMSNHKKLDELSSKMKENVDNLKEKAWTELSKQIQLLKKKIETDLEYLNNPRVLSSMKTQLEKRGKKRARLKRRNAEFHEEKVKKENERKMMNQQIDDWMRTQEEKAASHKRDEQLKKEAQVVLSEVTRRTAEANRQLELLEGLEKLRHLKWQLPQNKQDSKTIDSLIVFENLKKMWSTKLKEYELEEQGLRVMLSQANLETIKSKKCGEKEALNMWKQLLFGEEDSHQFYTDFSQLLLIRHQWDRFVAPHSSNTPGLDQVSSLIPIGWVLPSAPHSSAWKKFLADQ